MQYLPKSSISAVRRFNRFYTRRIGALQPHYLGGPYSLPQARVLYELGQRAECTASELGADLDLDLGYLRRLVQDLKRRGLVQGEAAKEDARRVRLTLTARGRKAYQQLDQRSRDEVGAMLSKLAAPEQVRLVGALDAHYLGSPFPLPQARVLYELGERGESTASELGADLDLDAGYLSRLLQGLRRQGLVQGQASRDDARRVRLSLTAKGRKAYQQLDARSRDEVAGMLGKLAAPEQARLADALQTVESLLKKETSQAPGISLRAHRPGDMGWVVHRHGALYFQEYGWDERFEALVAGIAAAFVNELDRKRERCWIAEMGGEPVGCVFLVKQTKTLAKLRLLIVEPKARGSGLGRRLVEECIAFARAKGYSKLVLWTQSNLVAARHLYKSTGFKLVNTQRHQDFGIKLTGEYWELVL